MNRKRPTLDKKYLIDYLKQLKDCNQINLSDFIYYYTLIVHNVDYENIVDFLFDRNKKSFKSSLSIKSLNYIYKLCECLDRNPYLQEPSYKKENYLQCQKNVIDFFAKYDPNQCSFLNNYFFSNNKHLHILKTNPLVPSSLKHGSNIVSLFGDYFVTILDESASKIEFDLIHELQHVLDFIRLKTESPYQLTREANPIFRELQYLDESKMKQNMKSYNFRVDDIRNNAILVLDALDDYAFLSFPDFRESLIYIISYLQALEMRRREKQGMTTEEILNMMNYNLTEATKWCHYFEYKSIGGIPAISIDNHFRFLEELEKDKRFIK